MERELDRVIERLRLRLIKDAPLLTDPHFFQKCARIAYDEMITIECERGKVKHPVPALAGS